MQQHYQYTELHANIIILFQILLSAGISVGSIFGIYEPSDTCIVDNIILFVCSLSAGISVGSIFGIYEPSETCMVDGDLDQSLEACITNVCQPGKNLLVAGYCLYSSCHTMVLTIGDGVYGFTLDPYVGEFVLTHNRIQVC
jgi:fructose-1,6-bisphosphatase